MNSNTKWRDTVALMDAAAAGRKIPACSTSDYPHKKSPGATDEMALNWLRRQQKSLRVHLNDRQRSRDTTAVVRIEGDTLYAWWL